MRARSFANKDASLPPASARNSITMATGSFLQYPLPGSNCLHLIKERCERFHVPLFHPVQAPQDLGQRRASLNTLYLRQTIARRDTSSDRRPVFLNVIHNQNTLPVYPVAVLRVFLSLCASCRRSLLNLSTRPARSRLFAFPLERCVSDETTIQRVFFRLL